MDNITTMVKYWDRLKPLMDEKGMGIQETADALDISFQAVVKVRDGGAFGLKNNIKAAKYFDVGSDWLATGKGDKHPATSNETLTFRELKFISLFRLLPSDQARNSEIAALEARVNDQSDGKGHTTTKKSIKAA